MDFLGDGERERSERLRDRVLPLPRLVAALRLGGVAERVDDLDLDLDGLASRLLRGGERDWDRDLVGDLSRPLALRPPRPLGPGM